MVQVITFQAPESAGLHDMSEEEIEAYVSDMASSALARLPEGIRLAGANAVEIEAMRPDAATAALPPVWRRVCAE
ncbi:hypothetical protein [Streptomyces sp. E2N166]|uniref:hypothetical protein n=1 Tax=Streptomyces sp. E2N166 TaxID=1851909 RepID=UPI000EF7325C|nr:hypothetical protein [Streptomyces sp. E2N166]